jgi:hypothetical protein
MSVINGREYQHATVDPRLETEGMSPFKIKTFEALSYTDRVTKENTNRADGAVDGYVFRNQELEASIRLKKSEWLRIQAEVADLFPDLGIGEIEFTLPVTYGKALSSLVTDTLYGVMFNEDARNSENNQDALVVEIPLRVGKIVDHLGRTFVRYED